MALLYNQNSDTFALPMNKKLFFIFSFICLLMGCKQDFKLTAPYKEVMVVYGLLSQQDNPVHYIRIQKGYLLEGNAYVAAGVADSIYYPNILKVALTGTNANYILTRVNGDSVNQPEDTGVFANTPNYLYRFSGNLTGGTTYNLMVIDTVTKDTVTSQTTLISTFDVTSPQPAEKISLSNTTPFAATWTPDANTGIYDLTIRFYYNEYDINTNALTKSTYIDIPALRSVTPTASSNTVTAYISEDNIVKYLANNLSANSTIYRKFVKMNFNFSAGGLDLAKFLTAQSAEVSSLASSDALPPYSNITNGVGLFSSRYYTSIDSVLLSPSGIDTLACGSDAGGLRFKNSVGSICF
jgi:hypothetical protein